MGRPVAFNAEDCDESETMKLPHEGADEGPVRVELPGHRVPFAIHFSRTPPPPSMNAAREALGQLRWQLTALEGIGPIPDDLAPSRQAALAHLYLPGSMQSPPITLLPASSSVALEVPWRRSDTHDLWLPATTAAGQRRERAWRTERYATPSAVELDFAPEDLASAAWPTLLQLGDVEGLIFWLSSVAVRLDVYGWCSPYEQHLADQMNLPDELQMRLRAEMGHRRPFLDARCLRWIICELAVAIARPRRAKLPDEAGQVALVRDTFLRSTKAGWPTYPELLRALWFLHEHWSYVPREHDDSIVDLGLAVSAAQTAGVRLFGPTEARLARAGELWSIEDAHPAVQSSRLLPSTFRRIFSNRTRLTTDEWIVMWEFQDLYLRARVLGLRDTARTAERFLSSLPDRKREKFFAAIRAHMAATPRQLGTLILDELRRHRIPYRGLGSLPRTPLRCVRDRPVLQTRDGRYLALGVGAVLDRVADLPRHLAVNVDGIGNRASRGAVGYFYQARVENLTRRLARPELRVRHRVAGDAELSAALGQASSKPDLVIVDQFDYLFVEVYSGSLTGDLAAGAREPVAARMKQYARKVGQAEAAQEQVHKVASNVFSSRRVDSCRVLVVTDEALPTNPAFVRRMTELRPGKNPKVVCSVEEFEQLVLLGEKGYSVPSLVAGWQQSQVDELLGAHLRETAERVVNTDDLRLEYASRDTFARFERINSPAA